VQRDASTSRRVVSELARYFLQVLASQVLLDTLIPPAQALATTNSRCICIIIVRAAMVRQSIYIIMTKEQEQGGWQA
jgi:hypothetical protein